MMKLKVLLLAALCLHVAAAAGAVWAGRARAFGGAFDTDGVASFASDGRLYRWQVVALEEKLRTEGVAAWARAKVSSHAKLYSLSHLLFSPLFGRTILSAEPLNLVYYLATLLLIYAVGRELYGERAGLLAASAFAAACPTFLLHATQMLKDPVFVALALALVLACLKLVTRDYATWRGGLLVGLAGGASAAALWSVRASMWWVVMATVAIAALLSVARQARTRSVLKGNLAGVLLVILMAVGASQFILLRRFPQETLSPRLHEAEVERARRAAEIRTGVEPGGLLSPVVEKISRTRAEFVEFYPQAASNIDPDVRLRTLADVVAYLPRAAVVGLCAPFPSMWAGEGGSTGRAGRVVAGFETLVVYFVEALALYGLWRGRRRHGVWFVVLAALVGVTALGLTVANAGALYRLRYLFWILFFVVASGTLVELLDARRGALADAERRC